MYFGRVIICSAQKRLSICFFLSFHFISFPCTLKAITRNISLKTCACFTTSLTAAYLIGGGVRGEGTYTLTILVYVQINEIVEIKYVSVYFVSVYSKEKKKIFVHMPWLLELFLKIIPIHFLVVEIQI